jgi:DNA-directed RNA polymerase subunit delta
MEARLMSTKNMTIEELEAMSYDDIAELILNESKKTLKINELFKKVCDLLKLSDDEFINKLPAFFDVISTDHRFIMLEDGTWDLKKRHSTNVIIDNDEEEEILPDEETVEEEQEEEIFYDEEAADDDTPDDDLKDFVIIDEDEETNG